MEFSLATLVSAGRIVNSSTFASLAFLVYDHVLTFDAEIRLVWNHPSQWSFGKILLIFNRYFGPFALILNIIVYTSPSVSKELYVLALWNNAICLWIFLDSCTRFHWWETTSEAIAILSVEVILMTRIYAVYERNRKLLVFFGMIFVAEVTGTLAIVDTGLPHSIPRPYGILAGCFVSAQPPLYFLTWIPSLVCESILCFLMLYKAWRMYEDKYDSALMRLIIRDSIVYFVTIFATLLINCLVWAFASQNFLEVALSWGIALPCALGSRLLFNMRERMYRAQTSLQISDIDIEMPTFRVAGLSGLSVASAQSHV